MRKVIAVFSAIVLLLCLSGCSFSDPVVSSLPKYASKEYYTSGGFQDFTDYTKYTYKSVDNDDLQNSPYFKMVTEDDIEEILLHIENFEEWVEICGGELEENYDFDKSIISIGDYFYIKTKYDETSDSILDKFFDYTVYFFDLDSQVLYLFQNNM